MKFCVVCSQGIGDALIFLIVAHHLKKQGHLVKIITPHRFGKWLDSSYLFSQTIEPCDALLLQISRRQESAEARKNNPLVYSFFGSRKTCLPPRPGFDFFIDPNKTMVQNAIQSLQFFFQIKATEENGITPPTGAIYKKFPKRVVIHTGSGSSDRNWSREKFEHFFSWAKAEGLDPVFLPFFPTLEEMILFIYESGFFVGNDSGPGHIASCLHIPHLIIAKSSKQMKLWKPGWGPGSILTPSPLIPNFKGFKLREKFWRSLIPTWSVIRAFQANLFPLQTKR